LKAFLFILAQSIVPWYLTPSPEPAKTNPDPIEVEEQCCQPSDTLMLTEADSIAVFKDTIDVTILLHDQKDGEGVDGNMIDFYNGTLMAARELGGNGVKMRLHVFSTSNEINPAILDSSEFILGPVNPEDILKVDSLITTKHHIISPLEHKAFGIADSLAIVHVPSPVSCQILDNIAWIKEEFTEKNEVIVISPDHETVTSPYHDLILQGLVEAGLEFRTMKLAETNAFFRTASRDITYRVLVDGVEELFISNTLRELSTKCMTGKQIVVYLPARVRTFENLKVDYMHNCNLRISASYYTNYSDENVRKFVRRYRALFAVEPNSFAFHGFDCLSYFISVYNKYGSLWYENLEEMPHRGLITSFRFEKQDKPGKTNTGISRMIFEKDFSITSQ